MTKNDEIQSANEETRHAWNTNATFWDERMGEGNDFFNILQWPAILRLLDPKPGQKILDIATGNGLTARRLAILGVEVTAFDFSAELIKIANAKPNPSNLITYHAVDATDESALLGAFGISAPFDASLCNMALFDMADIEPLFRTLPKLLKPGGIFIFTITHPAFNNTSCVHVAEEIDDEGEIKTVYAIKVSRYMTSYTGHGLAMRGQPQPQLYFDRPLQYYFNLGFQNGFVLDGFEERAFPPDGPQRNLLAWGGKFSEIPPVLVVRMRSAGS
jgi:2-polyprenyl-3-methyl-5-hydroxy-6-metoxy-1,4-benzoquinol methylase